MKRFGRVTVEPGKHGRLDYRISFAGASPKLSELIYMLGWMLKAEDRYDGRYHLGGILFAVHVVSVMERPITEEKILKVANDCDESVRNKRRKT